MGHVCFTKLQIDRAGLTKTESEFYDTVFDTQSDKILGATLAGSAAGILVHVFMARSEAGST